jgi:hypothetical protein
MNHVATLFAGLQDKSVLRIRGASPWCESVVRVRGASPWRESVARVVGLIVELVMEQLRALE